MASQAELKKRLKVLMNRAENQVCSDCPERQPRWASLIVPPPGSPPGSLQIGAFCCLECSGSHRRLGVHISFVRSINLDSWKEKEVLAMENGGNKKVNAIFEGRLPNAAYGPSPKPSAGASGPTREKYIRDKYERRKYFDQSALQRYLQGDDDDDDDDDDEEEEEPQTSRRAAKNAVRAPSDAAKLRAAKIHSRQPSAPPQPTAKPPAAAPPPPPAPAAVDLLDFGNFESAAAPAPTPAAPANPPVDMFSNMAISTSSNGTEVSPAPGNGISAAGPVNSDTTNSSTPPMTNPNGLHSPQQPKKMTSDDIMAMFNAPPVQPQQGFPSYGGAAMNGGLASSLAGPSPGMMTGMMSGAASSGPAQQMMGGLPPGSATAAPLMMQMGPGNATGPAGMQTPTPPPMAAGLPGSGSAGGNLMMMGGGMFQQNANSQGMPNVQLMMQQQTQMMTSMGGAPTGGDAAAIGGQNNTQMIPGRGMMQQTANGMGMQGTPGGASIAMNNYVTGATNSSNKPTNTLPNGPNMMTGINPMMNANNMMGANMMGNIMGAPMGQTMGAQYGTPMGGNMGAPMGGSAMGASMGGGGGMMMMSPSMMNAVPNGGMIMGGQQQVPQSNPNERFAALGQF